MKVLLQRVREARVEVSGETVSQIGPGLLLYLGIGRDDTTADADYLIRKTLSLRIFQDEHGKLNRSVQETNGAALVVSQFTLYGDTRKGRRPSFDAAALPEQALVLYDYFVTQLRAQHQIVETGVFQASMQVYSVNDGPLTFLCESARNRSESHIRE